MSPSSFETGWCPSATSMMLSRRTPIATPFAVYVPRSFGPPWVIASVIRPRTSGATTGRGSPHTSTTPHIPHADYKTVFPTQLGYGAQTARPPQAPLPDWLAPRGTLQRHQQGPCMADARRSSAPGEGDARHGLERHAASLEDGRGPTPVLCGIAQTARGEYR